MTDQALLAQLVGLPNARYPSDHLPLCFGFRFKKSDAFTSMLPFDGRRGEEATSQDGGAEGDQGMPRTLSPPIPPCPICPTNISNEFLCSVYRTKYELLILSTEVPK